ncbi:MAG: hypothetical protein JRJ87_14385 [Deltaproteobacteria bacterium]|nr:hypothetical protein [Deltaproteobacteria bacterium]
MVDTHAIYSLSERIQQAFRDEEFEPAVKMLEEFLDLEGADRRWALSLLQDALKQVRLRGLEPDSNDVLLEQEAAIRDELLSMDDSDEAWMHKWERVRQLNNKAWADYEAAVTTDDYLAALDCANQSLEFWPYFLPHLDTKLRCLLKLDRQTEAFAIVRWVEAVHPDWPDFEDLRSRHDYRQWLKSVEDEPLDLPDGIVGGDEDLPTIDPADRSRADQRLNEAERALLRCVRFGKDEWHRARNCALIAAILDSDLSVEELLSMGPQKADLTQGVYRSDQGELRISPGSLIKLRHWLIYGSTNHPSVFLPNPPLGIKLHMFIGWDLEKLTKKDVNKILAEISQRTGIEKLSLQRCRPLKLAGYEKQTGFVRVAPRGKHD